MKKEIIAILLAVILSGCTTFLALRLGLVSNWIDISLTAFLMTLVWLKWLMEFIKCSK